MISVVLLEAGRQRPQSLSSRCRWGSRTSSAVATTGPSRPKPEERLDGFRFTMPRGRVLGGSSSINGQVYSRGHPRDYDEWRQLGCEGWSFDDVLPFFRRAESWEEGGDPYRGGEGPLQTTRGRFEHPLYDAFLRAGESLGYGRTPDYNGASRKASGASSTRTPIAGSAAARARVRLPAPGAPPSQPRGPHPCPGHPGAARRRPGGGRRVPVRRAASAARSGRSAKCWCAPAPTSPRSS